LNILYDTVICQEYCGNFTLFAYGCILPYVTVLKLYFLKYCCIWF